MTHRSVPTQENQIEKEEYNPRDVSCYQTSNKKERLVHLLHALHAFHQDNNARKVVPNIPQKEEEEYNPWDVPYYQASKRCSHSDQVAPPIENPNTQGTADQNFVLSHVNLSQNINSTVDYLHFSYQNGRRAGQSSTSSREDLETRFLERKSCYSSQEVTPLLEDGVKTKQSRWTCLCKWIGYVVLFAVFIFVCKLMIEQQCNYLC